MILPILIFLPIRTTNPINSAGWSKPKAAQIAAAAAHAKERVATIAVFGACFARHHGERIDCYRCRGAGVIHRKASPLERQRGMGEFVRGPCRWCLGCGRKPRCPIAAPWRITLTRLAFGRGLDRHDGLAASCKWIVDGIAASLNVDDADRALEWRYAQRKCPRGTFGVEVLIETRRGEAKCSETKEAVR